MYRNQCRIINRSLWSALLPFALFSLAGCGGGSGNNPTPPVSQATLTRVANATRDKYKLPAVAVAVISSDAVVTNVIGVRKQGTNRGAELNDRFHLGSCAKAMTSAVIAMYVEEGKVSWDTKIRDLFPEIADVIRPEYHDLTLEMMLTMRSGLPALFDLEAISVLPTFSGTVTEKRRAFLKWAVQQEPESVPGEYQYSNANYVIAGAVVEKLSGKDWGAALQERLFRPLGITTVGYGWPASHGAAQPWGHILQEDGSWGPHDPDNAAEQAPQYFAPAGDVFMSIGDYAKFVQWNLRGLRGQSRLLRAETFQKLHTAPSVGQYAPGAWAVTSENGVTTSFYIGSEGTFMADVKIQSSRNRAVIAITNADGTTDTGDEALNAMEEIISPLLGANSSSNATKSRSLRNFRLQK